MHFSIKSLQISKKSSNFAAKVAKINKKETKLCVCTIYP